MRTPAGMWWKTPMDKWSAALDFAYSVRRGHVTERIGQWVNDAHHWKFQLDSEHYAEIETEGREALTHSVRTALSWTLEAAHATYVANWKELACEWAGALSELTDAELFRQSHIPSEMATNGELRQRLPGYFVWLHFHAYQTRSAADLHDFQHSVEEILEAFAPGTLVGWIGAEPQSSSLLALWSADTLAEDQRHHEDDEWSQLSAAAKDRQLIREHLMELIEVFATDALAPTVLSVGARISTPSELLLGLSTTVAAKNARTWISPQQKIVMWGEMPIITLLQSASDEVIGQFMQAAHLRSQSGDLYLSKDMAEALDGLIQANLNVSEASRILYIHRNTLMNRIDRIKMQTGYDIRQFHDALLLWLVQRLHGKFGL
jgi:hypothetical protein